MIYEYKCDHCNIVIEYLTNDYSLKVITCDRCKHDAHKIMSGGYLKFAYELTAEDMRA